MGTDNTAEKRSYYRLRKPEAASNILKSTLARYGLQQHVSKYKFILHWEEIVGKEIAQRSKPVGIKNNTLVIQVVSSTWSQELAFHKKQIIYNVNKYVDGHSKINDVMFLVGGK